MTEINDGLFEIGTDCWFDPAPASVVFSPNGEEIFRLNADGSFETGPGFVSMPYTAQQFMTTLAEHFPDAFAACAKRYGYVKGAT